MAGMGVKEARDWAAEKLGTANNEVVRDLLATVQRHPRMEALSFHKGNECSIVLTDLMLTMQEYDRELRRWVETERVEFDEGTTFAYKMRAYQSAYVRECARVSAFEIETENEVLYLAERHDRLMDARPRPVEEVAEQF